MSEEEEYTLVRLPPKVYDHIEKEVVALYKKLHISEIPIDPFKIASQLGYIVKKYSSLPRRVQIELKTKEQEGISHYDQELGTFIIYYDDSITYARIRFTIMHEIGHILLWHKEEKLYVYGKFPEEWKDRFSIPIVTLKSFSEEKRGRS